MAESSATKLTPVGVFDLVIFGGAGDLAQRKLLPSLFHRDCDGQLSDDSRIIAVGRRAMDRDAYLELVRRALDAALGAAAVGAPAWERFAARLDYVSVDARDHQSWAPLRERLAGHEDRIRAVYLATAPGLFGPVAAGFRASGLTVPDMRIVLEKPVGHDHASACAINDEVGACFPESQIFRIDHYLGKETVQNLLALRFGNALFEPLWRREVVDHVQFTVAEQLGVGNRVEFYDDIGTLRDMVQNHLMQLVCMVAMEPPSSLDDDAVRDEKLKVLRAIAPIGAADVATRTVRAQYTAGAIAGEAVPGYVDELGAASETETFVALKLDIRNWRWAGVPFYLRTGKRLPTKHSEIVIQFKHVPHPIFAGLRGGAEPNRLTIHLQPGEDVELSIMAKEPARGSFALRPVSLNLSSAGVEGAGYPDAYERLLVEVLRGRQALFMRRDEVEAAWGFADGILAGWAETGQKVERYVAGSWGPSGSTSLLDRDGRAWNTED